jgi:dephospho-CoA kinase
MIVIGLTGSVGMGKSTTAGLFAKEGIPVFDSDAAVHRLYASAAVGPVEDAFPGVTRDGIIDREALGRRVIGDLDAMTRLERIVHPLVRAEREAFLASARSKSATIVVLDVPLLFETGSDRDVDVVVLASAPEAVQKARVLARPGMTEGRFAGILAKQMPDSEKRRRARFIVDTNRGIDDAARQVRAVIAALEAEPNRA